MGIGGISIWKLVIILLIVIMLFGSKRLKGLGRRDLLEKHSEICLRREPDSVGTDEWA